ncbi:MAG: YhcH/YjgK/YiaL family protein, partial [Clostridia bacterium]|nr:YhcH/YjgK/YiaL family protein [Clostridia bacterium]
MILDRLENAKFYLGIHPGIDAILKKATEITPDNFPAEKLMLDGKKIFINPGNYETHAAEGASFEAHRAYVDVMCMIEGEETIYVKNTDALSQITMEYNPEKECLLAKLDADNTPVRLTAGSFCILFPQDAHAPGCHAEGPCKVKKLIGKVQL